MNDKDAVNEAYIDAVKQCFRVLEDGFIQANGNAGMEQAAVGRFKTAIAFARKARDAALQSI